MTVVRPLIFGVVSLGCVGKIRPASGTWGSAVSGLILWFIFPQISVPIRLGFTSLIFILGWAASHAVLAGKNEHDPHYIVIDEMVGMMITCALLSGVWWHYILAFIFFRFFDIAKFWPASIFDARPGAFAVMFDDVLMAVPALGCTQLIIHLLS